MGRAVPPERLDDDLPDDDEPVDERFLADEGLPLLALYRRIKDPASRKAVLEMIEAIVAEQDFDSQH